MHSCNDAEVKLLAAELLKAPSYSPSTNPIFRAFFKHYNAVLSPSALGDAIADIESPILKSHQDVLSCIQILKRDPMVTLNEFLKAAFVGYETRRAENEYATRAVVRATFMVSCASKDYYSEGFQSITARRVKWEPDQGFANFLEKAFTPEPILNPAQDTKRYRSSLKAWKLVRRNKIKIQPTNNLIDHLLYDPKSRVLSVFHQTMFLQSHIKWSKDVALDLNFGESLKL
ncbi:hypothetical protein ACLX1H_010984 [Fusarium chlamydosporum]